MDTNQLVDKYIQLREYKKKADDEYKKSMEKVNQAMTKLEGLLLDALNDSGAESVRTASGTVYLRTQDSATVSDRNEFMRWVTENAHWEALDVRANKTVVREVLENGHDVPGVKYTKQIAIGVRRPTNV